ncbi:MAG TPA: menaquinone biosynthesis protein [Candidatus Angelobacter sp.]|jgi:chorismate dehydratase|nr:menaquinone biosynthesis protein [Candidatus Angelobacter sp.]
MAQLRISAISFLNTAPLMWDFEHGDAGSHFEIDYTIPSKCAAALAAGQADIGIIPAVTYAQIPGLAILPGIAIAAKDSVRSILLVCKRPLEDVRTVATDTSSRTSVALTQILFAKFWGGHREFNPHPPDLPAMLKEHDAALLIGDSALQISLHDSPFRLYDLGHEWRALTGKPFVFAFWAVRLDALRRQPEGANLIKTFQLSREHGLQPENVDRIAEEWAPRLKMTPDEVVEYLTYNICYNLDRENHAGLQLFLSYACEVGLIPAVPDLRFLGPVAFSGQKR